jgi:CheY-like chemotaxis protein
MKAILFVDDHEVLARLACEILQMQGYRAEYAYKASEALAKFDHEKFDMLVTDYRMEEMDGLELTKLIRRKAPDLPVIVVSGYAQVESSGEKVVWLEKQDMFPALLEKVKVLLGEGEPEKRGGRETLKSA